MLIYILDPVGERRTMGFVRLFVDSQGRLVVIEGLTNR